MSALVEPHEIHCLTIEEYHDMVASGGLSETTRVEPLDTEALFAAAFAE